MSCALLVALCAIWIAPVPAPASPSRYAFELCDSALPGGGVTGVRWVGHQSLPFSPENSCADHGGALIIRQGDVSPGGSAAWAVPIEPPQGTHVESVSITAGACGAPPAEGNVFDGNWPPQTCLEETRSFQVAPWFEGVTIEQRCVGSCPAGPWVYAHYIAATVVDPVAPQLGGLEGTLLEAGPLRGRRSLEARAHDEGGGVSAISVLVNGEAAAEAKRASCSTVAVANPSVVGTVASALSPCPADLKARWSLDTGSYPFHDGTNTVQTCATDFATLEDPNLACLPARRVEVDDSCLDSGISGGQRLSAHFTVSRSRQITVGHHAAAMIAGRLTDGAGSPLAGADLCVRTRVPGSEREASGSTRTDAAGRYRYWVAPGPNREIVIGYRWDTELLANSLSFRSRARPSLELAPARVQNGESIRIRGVLPGPRPGGRVVVLQAGAPGAGRWLTFRRATTGRQGGFRASYRFNGTSSTATYLIRALVPRQAGYPWAQGHSRAVAVTVEGR